MNKISCDICMDLIPLVKDGIASQESCNAVKNHIDKNETNYFNDQRGGNGMKTRDEIRLTQMTNTAG